MILADEIVQLDAVASGIPIEACKHDASMCGYHACTAVEQDYTPVVGTIVCGGVGDGTRFVYDVARCYLGNGLKHCYIWRCYEPAIADNMCEGYGHETHHPIEPCPEGYKLSVALPGINPASSFEYGSQNGQTKIFYATRNTGSCIACPAGKSSLNQISSSNPYPAHPLHCHTSCFDCPIGQVAIYTSQKHCNFCADGYSSGHFSDPDVNINDCNRCADGWTTDHGECRMQVPGGQITT